MEADSLIRLCIKNISEDSEQKLLTYARFRMFRVNQDSEERDLYHEAILRTLDGRRKWDPAVVEVMTHLRRSMRSIAFEWGNKSRDFTELPELEDGGQAEARIEASLTIQDVRIALACDRLALHVLDAMVVGLTPAEARRSLHMSTNVYRSARKRISRTKQRLGRRHLNGCRTCFVR
jgi:hypothetical protein